MSSTGAWLIPTRLRAFMPTIPHCTTRTSPKFRSWPSMIFLYCTSAAVRISCLQRHTRVVEDTYHQLGGLITVIVKEGHAHHPQPAKCKPIADWIEQHMTLSMA